MATSNRIRGNRRDERTNPITRAWSGLSESFTASPARFAILIFTGLILITTLLLTLPIARAGSGTGGAPLADAVFTAVSAISVTGLATVDMASYWSPFGNTVIILAMQIGGIGVLTMASILGLIVARRIGLRAKLIVASDTNTARVHGGPVSESQAVRLGEIGGLLFTVVASAIVIELAITALVVPRLLLEGFDPWTAIWQGFYLSLSAFTNTGFVPFTPGVERFASDPWMLSVLSIAVFLGAIGFPVIFALGRWLRYRSRLTIHARITLLTTVILIAVGGLAIAVLEWSNTATLGGQDGLTRPMTAVFTSIMSRSGGLSTIDIGEMNGSTLLVLDMLMFVGGGSASTAGGIKVTTLAVLFFAAVAEARGVDDMEAFERRIPNDVLRLSVSIVLWGATIVATASIIILQLTDEPLDRVLFDVISAFATCGLSTGLTSNELPDAAKYTLAATMWAGRVGTVTLAAALAASQRRQLFRRAEERPIVG
ncbi:MAG: TrkH family potassium uptake protein [Microbacteriaceae bacterium]|nr:TrkH family potassium uptake protein [Microbacteriaceae bacterium]